MTLRELFDRIDKSQTNHQDPDFERWANELDIHGSWGWDLDDAFNKRVKGYWAIKWYCTDAWVGMVLYFLDDKPLGVTYQGGRKSPVEIEFVSQEMADELRSVIYELLPKQEVPSVGLANMDEDIGHDYCVSYSGQLLTDRGIVDGKEARVVQTFTKYEDIDLWTRVKVEIEGEEHLVNMSSFRIPYQLKVPT